MRIIGGPFILLLRPSAASFLDTPPGMLVLSGCLFSLLGLTASLNTTGSTKSPPDQYRDESVLLQHAHSSRNIRITLPFFAIILLNAFRNSSSEQELVICLSFGSSTFVYTTFTASQATPTPVRRWRINERDAY